MNDKIKIRLYLDVLDGYPLNPTGYLNATNNPGKKIEGMTRYGFDIWVDNPIAVDQMVQAENGTKLDDSPE